MPDIGDEVVVAFVHGDIDSAVILGSLWNATRKPPETLINPLNPKRVIQTGSGHRIEFDDTPGLEKLVVKHARVGTVSFEATPSGSTVSLKDAQGNSVTLTGSTAPGASDVTVESSGTIKLSAAKGITLAGDSVTLQSKTGGVSVEATGQPIALKGSRREREQVLTARTTDPETSAMGTDDETLGRGVAFPVGVDARGRLADAVGAEKVRQSILLILGTEPGDAPDAARLRLPAPQPGLRPEQPGDRPARAVPRPRRARPLGAAGGGRVGRGREHR